MAKKIKFKPTPAGILFLSAIAVLLIAIIILAVVGISRCKNNSRSHDPAVASESPAESLEPVTSIAPVITPDPVPETPDPDATTDPDATVDPNATTNPNVTPSSGETSGPGPIVINTPGQPTSSSGAAATATPNPYHTTPTSNMKKNAKKGYVNAESVNMRKGPGTKFETVKTKIAKNTAVTHYVEQEGWWFLKCGDKYGYIKKDYISQGSAPTAAPSGSATGKVVASKIALRKDAKEDSICIKEYKSGEQLTIYHYVKDSAGKKWYYVKTSDGNKGYMFAEYVKVTKGKVNAK